MADVFDLYVKDNRTIQFKFTEPIMLEDSRVTDWVFHIPRILNNIDVSGWAWWLVYINARGQKYSELLELSEDPESPLEKCIATYSVDYGMSIKAGIVRFSLEAINADTQGTILNEWHTQTYQAKVQDTLQGNQIEFAETESDIISALLIEVQNKVRQLTGGATPEPKNLVADMTDPKKVYLYVGNEENESNGYWYYHNGTRFVPGGLYASGIIVDATPTQGSNNAVSSGGVYDELENISGHAFPSTAKVLLINLLQNAIYTSDQSGTIEALNNALNVGDIVPVTGISLDAQSKSVTVGNTVSISATVTPSNATNKGVVWTSSDESVATVDGGVVTGRGQGTVIITAKTIDGGYTATCSVTSTIVNLLDRSKSSISNYVKKENGEITSSDTFDATDYIWLEPNTKYYAEGCYMINFYAFYNSSKTYVSSPPSDVVIVSESDRNWGANRKGTITTGSNGYYFRGSYNKAVAYTPYIALAPIE